MEILVRMSDNKLCKVYDCRFNNSHVTKGHLCGKCFKYGHGLCECANLDYKNKLSKFYNDEMPENNQCTFGGCEYKKLHSTDAHHCSICKKRSHSKNTCPTVLNQKPIEVKCPICKNKNLINKNQQKVFGISDNCVVCMCNSASVFFPNCGHVCICNDCIKIIQNDKLNDGYTSPYDENYLLEMKYDLEDIKIRLKEYPSYINIYNGMGTYTCIRRLNKDSKLECLFFSTDDIYDNSKMKINNDFINGYAHIRTNIIHDN